MINSITKVVLLGWFFSLILSSFNHIKAQTLIVYTNSDDCEVFIDDVKIGVGKIVTINLELNAKIKQLKVSRPGYNSEFDVVGSGDNELYINVTRKSYKDQKDLVPIALKDVFFEDPSMTINYYDYKKFRKKQFSGNGSNCKQNAGLGDFENYLRKNLMHGLTSTGIIDTSFSNGNVSKYSSFLTATLKLYRFYFYEVTTDCSQMSMQMDADVLYEFNDKFGNEIYKVRKGSKAGVYSLDALNWLSLNSEEREKIISRTMEEAIANSLYDLLADSSIQAILNYTEPMDASKMEPLQLKFNSTVSDMKTALKATVTVKTDDSFGSGCVVSNDGYILTSYHVISGKEGSDIQILSNTGDTIIGKVVRTSRLADLALIKVNHHFTFTYSMKNNSKIEVTDEVYAIGTPASMELSQTVSKGIVSSFRQNVDSLTMIQTDVPVNPGNSGGPLIKLPDIFVGVVNSKIFGNKIEGLSFCTPVSDIIKYLKLK